jgi:Txe/YoeB family toxin of Txe-Axe toxin-antitoxin module
MSADSLATLIHRKMNSGRMKQIIRELKRQVAGEKLEPEQLKGLIRGGYVYRNGDEHQLTDMGREALAQPGVNL